jgi:hypothetical protein
MRSHHPIPRSPEEKKNLGTVDIRKLNKQLLAEPRYGPAGNFSYLARLEPSHGKECRVLTRFFLHLPSSESPELAGGPGFE